MLPLYFFAQETVAGETATEDSVEGGISSVPTIADPATASATKAVADILPEGTPEWVQTSVVYGIPYGIGALKVLVILLITILAVIGFMIYRSGRNSQPGEEG